MSSQFESLSYSVMQIIELQVQLYYNITTAMKLQMINENFRNILRAVKF